MIYRKENQDDAAAVAALLSGQAKIPPGSVTMIAEDHGEIVGVIVSRPIDVRCWAVSHLAVHPQHICRGIQSGLLREIVEIAAIEGDDSKPVDLVITGDGMASLGLSRSATLNMRRSQ